MVYNRQSLDDILKNNQQLNAEENRFVRGVIAKSGVTKNNPKGHSACYIIDTIYCDGGNVDTITVSCYPIDDGACAYTDYNVNCIETEPCVKLVCRSTVIPTIVDGEIKDKIANKGYRRTTLQILKDCVNPYTRKKDIIYAQKVRQSEIEGKQPQKSAFRSALDFITGKKKADTYKKFLIETGFSYSNQDMEAVVGNVIHYSIEGVDEGSYLMKSMLDRPQDGENFGFQIGANSFIECPETVCPKHKNPYDRARESFEDDGYSRF